MPLFTPQISRKPNLYPWTEEFINRIWAGFWTVNEFTFQGDLGQFHSELSEEEKGIITRTLCSIGQVEIAVKRFWAGLGDNLPHPCMSDLGYALANSEVIHNKAYERLLEVLGLERMFEEYLKVPALANRVTHLRQYLTPTFPSHQQYIYSTILFTLFIENVSLFSQFYIILWFNRFKNVLKDTAQQVQYTRNEEALHAQVGIKLINTFKEEYPEFFTPLLQSTIQKNLLDCMQGELALIQWIIGDYSQPSLSFPILSTYIQNRANESLTAIGFTPIFPTQKENLPLIRWMDEELLGNNMTDFFHKRPVEYAKKGQAFNREDLF